jgi:hypothetical protein
LFFNFGAVDIGKCSTSLTGHFTATETAPKIRWLGGWVVLRTSSDAMAKRKICTSAGNIVQLSGRSDRSLVTILTELLCS